MLYLHTSHQLEQLTNIFSVLINKPLQAVFATEMVVVQNAGMGRYLSMQVADISGISANTDYLFPAEFMWKLLRLVSSDIPEKSQCTPKTMRFHIMEELTQNFEEYPELHHYILSDGSINTHATWNLSCELSQTLDQYLFYRSDWIQQWESEPAKFAKENWQARLWLRCATDKKLVHWLALQKQFKHSINTIDTSLLPERISFFSMSSLSPGYIDLLGEIGKKTDVHLFIMNPCEDVYWGDITSLKAQSKMPVEQQVLTDIGNPLLSSMGKQGRDFIHQLLDLPDVITTTDSQEKNSTLRTEVLTQCQNDIFNLKTIEPITGYSKELDNSITINACHTAMREVEVLHDQILAALENDTTLAPSEIVVMMPNIDQYAPYIEAIFASDTFTASKQSLPFSIADRSPLVVHSIIEALLKAIRLTDTRYDVESVFELLDYEAIRQCFDLDEIQVTQCRSLAAATNIRWGINSKNRAKNNLPNTDEHTWKYALDNLLLGYTMGEALQGEQLFKPKDSKSSLPLFPYINIEGNDATILSQFKQFTDCLFKVSHWLDKGYNLETWLEKIKDLLQHLFAGDSDYSKILLALNDLESDAKLAEFDQKLPFSVFQKILEDCLESVAGIESYLGHGITFCSLVPMRSMPFKLIALMGMNDGEFPRQDMHHSFDLMAAQQRRGDRSRRDEDRYLFLESILAARSRLIISFVGQSIKDNTDLPPSILVSELLETLSIYSGLLTNDWVCRHPLQAYSPRYFNGIRNDIFSYVDEYTKLSRNTKTQSHVFIKKRLPELDKQYKTVSLTDLIRFFQSPARTFLKHRFAIQTFDENTSLPSREPFELESFKDQEIRKLALEDKFDESLLIARAKGLLPYGEIGDKTYFQQKQIINGFKEQLPELEAQNSQPFQLKLGEFQLEGKLNHLTTQGRIIQNVSQPYVREYLDCWINHLVFNSSVFVFRKENKQTQFYSPEVSFSLSAVEEADKQLEMLLQYYWEGLHFPLQFFPKSAFNMYKDSGKENQTKASSTWKGNQQITGESNLFENWLLHRNIDFSDGGLPEEFLESSQNIFGNLFLYLN